MEENSMSIQVQLRRDTDANVANFTGKAGEVVVETTSNRLVVQDGATVGGFPTAKLADITGTNTTAAQFASLGIGGIAGSNQLTVNGASALFNGTTSFNHVINKSAAGNSAGMQFQDAYTSYAQFGLLGNDNLTFQVGSSLTNALVFDKTTAIPTFPKAPKFSAFGPAAQINPSSTTWTLIVENSAICNIGSNFSTSTGLFTAPINGVYDFIGSYMYTINSTAPTGFIGIGFGINGGNPAVSNGAAIYATPNMLVNGSNVLVLKVISLLNLTAGQTVGLYANVSGGNFYIAAGNASFCGCLVP
jgi:hypothetical protein